MNEQKKSITMKDVAAEAGVSVGTVSRVINKEQGIKEVTLKKVQQAIEKLSYVPDHYARGMKKNRTETIALILPTIWHPFFSEFAMFVEREISRRGNKLLVSSVDGLSKEQEVLSMLRQNKVDGIVAITYNPVEDYMSVGLPFVSVDRIYPGLEIPCVTSDNEAGGREAARQLINKGCQHIAFIGNHNDTFNETKKRRQSFESYAKSCQHPYSIFDWDESGQNFLVELRSFLKTNQQIDGIFAINDFTALDAIEILGELKRSVPEDVQVIGYDGIKMAQDRNYVISTIKQPLEEMAKAAVSALFNMIESKPVVLQTILPITYVDGKTTKK